jgi:Type III secretion protein YscO
MFADLLRIKKFREDAAARAVKVSEQEVALRRQAVRDAEEALEKHRTFRLVEEDRLFDEIKGIEVSMKKIDAMKGAVAQLRDDEARLERAIGQARKAVPPAEETLAQTVAAHRDAVKATQKFAQFVEIQQQTEKKEASRREEAELEETSEAGFAAAHRGATP